ncbi:MAG: TetR/AcrR family transcriptional regulator [Pyrinomonadaceae bacterium]
MTKKVSIPAKGRPREFDREQALGQALKVFWSKGYEGASLTDLTAAMGINRPSLYAAFGDKESLFRAAVDRYEAERLSFIQRALDQPTALAVVESMLQGVVRLQTRPGTPAGCFMVQAALVTGDGAKGVCEELRSRRSAGEVALRKRLQRAKKEGDLSSDANPADLARYVSTVIRGLAVQAASGATSAELRRVVQLTLRAWPG